MAHHLKDALIGQYEAALSMLRQRIEVCPDNYWNEKVGQSTIRQDSYHVLFYLDYYLSSHEDTFRVSDFVERGGDERRPVISEGLSKKGTLAYIDFCHNKIIDAIEKETPETLEGSSGFPSIFKRRPLSRTELHLYTIRHVQHHTAQISMVLRKLSDEHSLGLSFPWFGAGWQ